MKRDKYEGADVEFIKVIYRGYEIEARKSPRVKTTYDVKRPGKSRPIFQFETLAAAKKWINQDRTRKEMQKTAGAKALTGRPGFIRPGTVSASKISTQRRIVRKTK